MEDEDLHALRAMVQGAVLNLLSEPVGKRFKDVMQYPLDHEFMKQAIQAACRSYAGETVSQLSITIAEPSAEDRAAGRSAVITIEGPLEAMARIDFGEGRSLSEVVDVDVVVEKIDDAE